MSEEEKLTLLTEIRTDFDPSKKSAGEFVGQLDELNKKLGSARDIVKDMNLTFTARLKKALDEVVRDGETIEVDGQKLAKRLEDAVVKKIMAKGVEVNNIRDDKISVNIDPQLVKILKKKVEDYFESAVDKVDVQEIKGNALKSIKVPSKMLSTVRDKLVTKLEEKLIDPNIMVDVDGNSIELEKIPIPLNFKYEHLKSVANEFQNKLINHLVKGITLDKLPELDISTVNMTELTKALQAGISELDKEVAASNIEAMKKFNVVKEKLAGFSKELGTLINELAETINGVKLGSLNDDQISQLRAGLETARNSISLRMNEMINGINSEIMATPISTFDTAQVKGLLERVENSVNELITNRIDAVVAVIASKNKVSLDVNYEALDKLREALKSLSIDEASVQALENNIKAAVNKAVAGCSISLGSATFNLEAYAVREIYKKISAEIKANLEAWKPELVDGTNDLLRLKEAIAEIAPDDGVVKKLSAEIKQQIQKSVQNMADAFYGVVFEVDPQIVTSLYQKIEKHVAKSIKMWKPEELPTDGLEEVKNILKDISSIDISTQAKIAKRLKDEIDRFLNVIDLTLGDAKIEIDQNTIQNVYDKIADKISADLRAWNPPAGLSEESLAKISTALKSVDLDDETIVNTITSINNHIKAMFAGLTNGLNEVAEFKVDTKAINGIFKKIAAFVKTRLSELEIPLDLELPAIKELERSLGTIGVDSLDISSLRAKIREGILELLDNVSLQFYNNYMYLSEEDFRKVANKVAKLIEASFKEWGNNFSVEQLTLALTGVGVKETTAKKLVGRINKEIDTFLNGIVINIPQGSLSGDISQKFFTKLMNQVERNLKNWTAVGGEFELDPSVISMVYSKIEELVKSKILAWTPGVDANMSAFKELDDALKGIDIDKESLVKMLHNIQTSINNLVSGITVIFDNIPDLEISAEAINRIFKQISAKVERELSNWKPRDENFTGLDGETVTGIVRKIEEEVNDLAKRLSIILVGTSELEIGADTLREIYLKISKAIETSLKEWDPYKGFQLPVDALNKEVRKALADQAGVTLKEWTNQNPHLQGEGGVDQLMRGSISAVMNMFHKSIITNINSSIEAYKNALDHIGTPDVSAVHLFLDGLKSIQESLNNKLYNIVSGNLDPLVSGVNAFQPGAAPPVEQLAKKGDSSATPQPIVDFGEGLEGFMRPIDPEEIDRRVAMIKADRVRNRFRGRINEESFVDINHYLEQYVEDYVDAMKSLRSAQDIESQKFFRDNLKDVKTRLDYEVEQWARQGQFDKSDRVLLTHEMKLNDNFDKFSLRRDGMLQKYAGKVSLADFDIMANKLDAIVGKAELLAHTPIFDEGDIQPSLRELAELEYEFKKLELEAKTMAAAYKEANKELEKISKQGRLLGKFDELKGKSYVPEESFRNMLTSIDALKEYEIIQASISGKTGTWTARVKDLEGNIRNLGGSFEKLNGELYQHSSGISSVMKKQQEYMNNMRRISEYSRFYFPQDGQFNFSQDGGINPGGDTHSFMGSVVNTMRYITAGSLIGLPSMAVYKAWDSAKEFDYQMAKAKQNVLIKDPSMMEAARSSLIDSGRLEGVDQSQINDLIKKEAAELKKAVLKDNIQRIQGIALANSIAPEDVARAYEISTRAMDDPTQAILMTQQIAKARSIEEIDVDKAAAGFEAIRAQWKLTGYDLEKTTNMLIKASNMYSSKIEDILAVQQRSGAIFQQGLPGMTKERALASAFYLSAIFSQSTGRKGGEGGTFFKMMLERPFRGDSLEALKEFSSIKGLEELNPFKTDPKTGQKMKKNVLELYASIMEAIPKMPDDVKASFIGKFAPQWHIGSLEALTSYIHDTVSQAKTTIVSTGEASKEEVDKMSVLDIMNKIIDKIQSASPEEVAAIQAGMADTWKFRTQRVETMWSNATYNVIESLKPQFENLSVVIGMLLRQLKDNAQNVAGLMIDAGKIAAMLGIRYVFNKVHESVEKKDQQDLAERFDKGRYYLNEQGRRINLRRIALEDRMIVYNSRVGSRDEVRAKLDKAHLDRAEMVASGASAKRLEGQDKHINNLTQALERLNRVVERDAEELKQLEEEMAQLSREAIKFDRHVEMMDASMKDLGINASMLKNNLNMVGEGFRNSSIFGNTFQEELGKVSSRSDVAKKELLALEQELKKVQDEFERSAKSAKDFEKMIMEVKRLERAHLAGVNQVPGGGVLGEAENQKGIGLFEALLGAWGLKKVGGVLKDTKRSGIVGGIKDLFGKAKNTIGAVRTGETTVAEVLSTSKSAAAQGVKSVLDKIGFGAKDALSTTAEKATTIGKRIPGIAKTLGKVIPQAKMLLWGFDALEALSDPITAMGMTEAEKANSQVAKKKELINQAINIDKSGIIGKIWNGSDLLSKAVFGGLGHALGGNGPSWGDYLGAFKDMATLDGDALEEALRKRLLTDKDGMDLDTKAKIEQYKEDLKNNNVNPLDQNHDGLLDENIPQELKDLDIESINEVIQSLQETLTRELGKNDTDMNIKKISLLTRGYSEDSKEIRAVMKEYFEKNIKALDEMINKLEQNKQQLTPDSEGYKKVDEQLNQVKLQKAQMQLSSFQNDFSAIDDINSRMDRERAMLEAQFSVQKSSAIIGGASEDSETIRAIERKRVATEVSSLNKYEQELRTQFDKFAGKQEQQAQILLQIQQIEAEKKSLVAELVKASAKATGTFNLPSGIRPMTYFDAMSANNTHSNYTTRMGDVTVNINVDNLHGSQESADMIANTVSQVVRNQQRNMANLLASDVRNGVGSNYLSTIGR